MNILPGLESLVPAEKPALQAVPASSVADGAKRYAQVLVDVTARSLDNRVFTYAVPAEFAEDVQVGMPVLVPFGGQSGLTGFVVGVSDEPPASDTQKPIAYKSIVDVLDDAPLFNAEYFSFLEWVADYYATPITQVLTTALPANLIRKNRKTVYAAPAVKDPALLFRLGYASGTGARTGRDSLKAHQLVEYLRQSLPTSETQPMKGYAPKHLANRFKLSLKGVNQILAKLKTVNAVEIVSELSGATGIKTVKTVAIAPDFMAFDTLSKRQREVVEYLLIQPHAVPMQTLVEAVGTTSATVKKMRDTGAVVIEERPLVRDPLVYYQTASEVRKLKLSGAQEHAVEEVMAGSSEVPYLLYGVTGSGKTEVYLELTRRMLAEGKSVLVMVPEIALTSQIARRFMACFGKENIALWHSNLSDGERADTWRNVQSGELKILIGARSGIWAPLQNLGVVIIDEEHDSSFKQDSPAPRYNTKTLALELARRKNAKVLLGSATPDMATFYAARDHRSMLRLPERFGGQMAEVKIADMKLERAEGNQSQLSRLLQQEMEKNLEAKEQSIILINRRGFYTTITCTTCDHVFMCPNCDVAVTFHRTNNRVHCHYCGYENSRPQYCPVCASMELNSSGVGTQRIEEEIIKRFPDARVLRLDSDVMQRKHASREIFEAFSQGEADILIGTQMVAKGLDVANVTLVGVISADATFSLPDYKSTERGFQLLTQVAGRAGRGSKNGRVVFQAIYPSHKVFEFAQKQDYESFYTDEIMNRQALDFPPFSQLFRLVVSCENEKKAQQYTQAAAAHLRQFLTENDLLDKMSFLGPAACVLPRIQNRFRFHFLIKNMAGEAGHRAITQFYKHAIIPEDINFILDIDAQSLL